MMLTIFLTARWAYGQSEQPFRIESVAFNVTGDHGTYAIQSHSGRDSHEATSTAPTLTVDIESHVCYWNRIVNLISAEGEIATVNIVVEQPCYRGSTTDNTQSSPSTFGAAGDGSDKCPDWPDGHSHNSVNGPKHHHLELGNVDSSTGAFIGSYIPHRHTFSWSPGVQECDSQYTIRE